MENHFPVSEIIAAIILATATILAAFIAKSDKIEKAAKSDIETNPKRQPNKNSDVGDKPNRATENEVVSYLVRQLLLSIVTGTIVIYIAASAAGVYKGEYYLILIPAISFCVALIVYLFIFFVTFCLTNNPYAVNKDVLNIPIALSYIIYIGVALIIGVDF